MLHECLKLSQHCVVQSENRPAGNKEATNVTPTEIGSVQADVDGLCLELLRENLQHDIGSSISIVRPNNLDVVQSSNHCLCTQIWHQFKGVVRGLGVS